MSDEGEKRALGALSMEMECADGDRELWEVGE